MSFDLTLPPILGVVGLAIAFVIYTIMSRYDAGGEKVRGIADQIHLGAMVFMHREYKMLFAFAAVLVVGILVSPLGTNTAIAFVAGAVSSATAGYLGMYAATKANVRTAVAANQEGAAAALNIAFYGGSIMGLCVASLGLHGPRWSLLLLWRRPPHCPRDPWVWHGRLSGRTLLSCRWRYLSPNLPMWALT